MSLLRFVAGGAGGNRASSDPRDRAQRLERCLSPLEATGTPRLTVGSFPPPLGRFRLGLGEPDDGIAGVIRHIGNSCQPSEVFLPYPYCWR